MTDQEQLDSLRSDLHCICESLREIVVILKQLLPPPVEGIEVSPGTPTSRKEVSMAKVKLVQKGAMKGKAAAFKAGAAIDFVIQDNQDDTFTVSGVDAAGAPVDISTVATLTASSSDPTSMTVDTPVGTVVTGHALKATTPGTPVVLTFTATWNDGSIGPFTVTLPVDITGSAATGLVVTPGTPTIRP